MYWSLKVFSVARGVGIAYTANMDFQMAFEHFF